MAAYLGTYWFLALAFLAGLCLAIGGLLVVRRFAGYEELSLHHDVAGCFLSIIGTLYAVVLGFMVVDSLNTFERARVTVEQEANALHDIYHLTEGLPLAVESRLRTLCTAYAAVMIDDEWKEMAYGRMSPKSHEIMSAIWDTVSRFQPATPNEQNIHSALLSELDQMGDSRHTRLLTARASFDGIVWALLIFGAFVIVVFTYFFGLRRLSTQILMTVLVTSVLGLNLALVGMFRYPFSGDVRVMPDAFKYDLRLFLSNLKK